MPNVFGDILSDLGPACTGTIAVAPSGSINPEGKFPSLFEPVHGSTPDIFGKMIANPIGQMARFGVGAMILDHLGYPETGKAIFSVIEKVLSSGAGNAPLTPDLGGSAKTDDLGKAIAAAI
uniref:Tartrate dehydrogenase n=1 Tax=Polynucleobacter necessarius subsp. necessarius (strain STIR1) TaxID=452638 RepID=B1XUL5_POLNS